VVTTEEFLSALIPEFEIMLQGKPLGENISKIADQASKVQKEYSRNYVKLVK
jgi:hypothetical protein